MDNLSPRALPPEGQDIPAMWRHMPLSIIVSIILVAALPCLKLAGWTAVPLDAGLIASTCIVFAAFLVSSRPLLSSATWVLGYLLIETCVRSLSLLYNWEPFAPLYRLIPIGPELNSAIVVVMWQTLLGVVFFVAAYIVANRRCVPATGNYLPTPVNSLIAYLIVGSGLVMLPVEHLHQQVSPTIGGDFLIQIPGLMVTGLTCLAAGRAMYGAKVPRLLLVTAVTTEIVSVLLLHDKTGLLALTAAASLGWLARRRETRASVQSTVRHGATLILVSAGVLGVFTLALANSPAFGAGPTQALEGGLKSLVSRSYDADSMITINDYINRGGDYLNGSSLKTIPIAWIPRQIWPDKPKSFSEVFGQKFFVFSPQSGIRFFSPGFSGEWYLNFGWLGIVVGWCLFGLLLGFLDRRMSLDAQFLIMPIAVHFVEGPMDSQIYLAMPLVAGALLALYAGRRQRSVPVLASQGTLTDVLARRRARPAVSSTLRSTADRSAGRPNRASHRTGAGTSENS